MILAHKNCFPENLILTYIQVHLMEYFMQRGHEHYI